MKHLSNDHKDRPNQHENSHKLCDGTQHPFVNLMESQWQLRQHHAQDARWLESHCRTNISVRRRNKSKRARLRESQPGIRVGILII